MTREEYEEHMEAKRLYDTNYVLETMLLEDACNLLEIVTEHHKANGTSASGEHYRVRCAINRMIHHLCT